MRDNDGKSEVVKIANGGGHRFITFAVGEEPTFNCLLDRALDIFFINGSNYYGERKLDVHSTIVDSSETLVDLTDTLSNFMKERGLFPSRTYFYLKTSPVERNLSDIESDGDEYESILDTPVFQQQLDDTSVAKRKICSVCSHTYIHACLRCIQDKELQKSCDIDKMKNLTQASTHSAELPCVLQPEVLDVTHLRERRIRALSQPTSSNNEVSFHHEKKYNSLKELLEDMTDDFLKKGGDIVFQVRRRQILNDVLKKMKIFFSNKELSKIKVEFVSFSKVESGVDTGGPGRELFALLYEQAVGMLMEGELGQHVLLHDLVRLENQDFFTYGQCIALALLHGYDSPHQFCKGLSGFISGKLIGTLRNIKSYGLGFEI